MLSRYYGHISHLDRVPIKYDDPKDKLLAARSVTIPLRFMPMAIPIGIAVTTARKNELNTR